MSSDSPQISSIFNWNNLGSLLTGTLLIGIDGALFLFLAQTVELNCVWLEPRRARWHHSDEPLFAFSAKI